MSEQLTRIMVEVAGDHGLELFDLFTTTRSKTVTDARAEYFYRALKETTMSSVQIAKAIGRDHSTALHGAARHANRKGLQMPRGHGRKKSLNCDFHPG